MLIRSDRRQSWHQALTLTLATTLAACGGGGGGGSGDGTATVSGTAAVGSAITGASIEARCSDGSGFIATVTTSATGTFSGEVARDALPCALKLSGGTITGGESAPVLYSMASAGSGDITAHITPLTHLVLSRAVAAAADAAADDKSVDAWFDSLATQTAPAARVAAAAIDNPNGLCVLKDTTTFNPGGKQTITICQYQVTESWCDDNDGMVIKSTSSLASDTTRTATWTATCPANRNEVRGNPLGGPGTGGTPTTPTTPPNPNAPHHAQALLDAVNDAIDTAIAAVRKSLKTYNSSLAGTFNPFTGSLQAGTPSNAYDALLEQFRAAVLDMIGNWLNWLDYVNAYGIATSPSLPQPAPATTPPATPPVPTGGAKTWSFDKDSSQSVFLGAIAGDHAVVITSGPVTGAATLSVAHGGGRVTMTLKRGSDILFSGNPLLNGDGEKNCAGSSRLACGLVLQWLDPSDKYPFAPAGTPGKDVNIWHYYNEGSAGQTGMRTVWLPNGVIRGMLSSNYAPTYTFSNYETADETEEPETPAEQEGPAEVRALAGSYSGKVTSQNASLGFPERGAAISVTVSDKGSVTVGSQVFAAGGYTLSKLDQSYLPEPRYELKTGNGFEDRKLTIFLDLATGKPRVFQVSQGSPAADVAIAPENDAAMQQFMTDLIGKGEVTLYRKGTCESAKVSFAKGPSGQPLSFEDPDGSLHTYNDRSARFTAADGDGSRKLVMNGASVFLTSGGHVRIGLHSNNSTNIHTYWSADPAERNCP